MSVNIDNGDVRVANYEKEGLDSKILPGDLLNCIVGQIYHPEEQKSDEVGRLVREPYKTVKTECCVNWTA